MGLPLTNASAVLYTATCQVPLQMSGRCLRLQFDRRMDEVLGIEGDQRSAQILGVGVKEAGHSLGRGEQQMKTWSYLCWQDHKHTRGDICREKDRVLNLLVSMSSGWFRI